MSTWSTPLDYFNLDASPLKLKSSSANKTLQTKEAQDDRGDNVAREVYGAEYAPSCEFEVIASGNVSASLGSVNTEDSIVCMLTGLSIATKFNTPPKVTASGVSLQSGATATSTVATGNLPVSVRHKAQTFSAFTLTGGGCELNESNLEVSSRPSLAKVAGDTVAHDIAADKLTVKATIIQTGDTPPTVTAAEGWEITQELTQTDQDTEYRTWTCELVKDLTSAEPA